MQITIFGATTLAGKQFILDGLALGHHIVAYGRNVYAETLPENKDLLRLHPAGVFDKKEIYESLKGSDAVICALEGTKEGEDFTRSLGTKYIVEQMNKAGILRIVTIGGTGIMDGFEEEMIMFQEDYPEEKMSDAVEDLKALQALETSNLEWTMVVADEIKPGEPDGMYLVRSHQMPDTPLNYVSVGNLSQYCWRELEKKEFPRSRVGIRNFK